LKYRFFNLTQDAFWARQEVENKFAVPGDNLKHRFLDLPKLAFWACSRYRKWVKCAMREHESSLYRLRL